MKLLIYFLCLGTIALATACIKIDTYHEPQETLTGSLKDGDGDLFISEQPNGFKIILVEKGATTPREFWGKPDGSFYNSKVFKGVYKIVPSDGAFFPVDTVEQEINGITTVNFQITPFLKINATIKQDGGTIEAKYRIKKSPGAGKIKNARVLVSKWNPNVGMNYSDLSVMRDFTHVDDSEIVQNEYTDQIPIESGVIYYARVAVLSENALGKYNFSSIQKVDIP